MISIAPSEWLTYFDSGNIPDTSYAWTLQSPDLTIWGPTISTAGIVSVASGATAGASVTFVGLDGHKWTPAISNGGIITATQGAILSASDAIATLVDSADITWVFFVDDDSEVQVTTAEVLPSLLRYPAFVFAYTPTTGTDRCLVHSIRPSIASVRHSS